MKFFHMHMKMFFCLLLLAGCATYTEAEKTERAYAREARELERLDRWYEDKARCKAHGGTMLIKRWRLPFGCRNGTCPPEHGDFYTCASQIIIRYYHELDSY